MSKSEELKEEALRRVFEHLSKNKNLEVVHPTEHDESDELEEAKNTSEKIVCASQLHSATSLFHLLR